MNWQEKRDGDSMTRENLIDYLVYYDVEVFKYDWLCCFAIAKTNEQIVIYNDSQKLKDFLSEPMILCGFNNKNYDQYILKAIISDVDPKLVNDWIIIQGNGGWEYPEFIGTYTKVPAQIDLMQDTLGISLKEIEGNIGLNIKETDVDFNLDRPLTSTEMFLTIKYCQADVAVLPKLWELRQDYINAKITLCEMADIPLDQGLGMTNAKLTAKFLGAVKQNRDDERSFNFYELPVDWKDIPIELMEYFDKYSDLSVDWEEYLKSSAEINIGKGVRPTYGLGGVHYAKNNLSIVTEETDE